MRLGFGARFPLILCTCRALRGTRQAYKRARLGWHLLLYECARCTKALSPRHKRDTNRSGLCFYKSKATGMSTACAYLCHASSHGGAGMTPIPASLYICTVTSSMLLNFTMAARTPACTLPLP